MKKWMRRVRGALCFGIIWATGGALLGFAIELLHNAWPNPFGSLVDIWPAALAYPAFLGGLAFSTVLGIVGRGRRFDELSLPAFAAWGALGGLLVSLVPVAAVGTGLVTLDVPPWRLTAALAVPLTLGSAIAASASLALARMSEDPASADRSPARR